MSETPRTITTGREPTCSERRDASRVVLRLLLDALGLGRREERGLVHSEAVHGIRSGTTPQERRDYVSRRQARREGAAR